MATWTYSGGHNSDLAISGGTINGDVKSVTYDGAEGKTAKVSITGGVVNVDWSRFLGRKNKLLQATSRSRSHGAL